MKDEGYHCVGGSVAMFAALSLACGPDKPAAEPLPPPAPVIADLPVVTTSAWDSLQVAIAGALQNGNAAQAKPLRDRLMKFPEEPGKGDPNSGHDAMPGPSRAVRLYLLGELANVLKDKHGLDASVDSLLSPMLVGGTLPRKPGGYGLALQALQFIWMRDTLRAIERLDSALVRIPESSYPMLWVGGTMERPRRIDWLRKTGRDARADSLHNTISDFAADRLVRKK